MHQFVHAWYGVLWLAGKSVPAHCACRLSNPPACSLLSASEKMVSSAGHAVWVSAEMYSAPSIVLQSRRPDGGMHVFDDFREAYAWLRHNTDPSAKVRSVQGCCPTTGHAV